jgi:hypothetical protein
VSTFFSSVNLKSFIGREACIYSEFANGICVCISHDEDMLLNKICIVWADNMVKVISLHYIIAFTNYAVFVIYSDCLGKVRAYVIKTISFANSRRIYDILTRVI